MTVRYQLVCDKCKARSLHVFYLSTLLMHDRWYTVPSDDPAIMPTHLCPDCARNTMGSDSDD